MVELYHFVGLIFVDACTHAHYVLYNWAHFAGLIFAVRWSSTKTVKIGPLENFLLYSFRLEKTFALFIPSTHWWNFLSSEYLYLVHRTQSNLYAWAKIYSVYYTSKTLALLIICHNQIDRWCQCSWFGITNCGPSLWGNPTISNNPTLWPSK